MNQGFLLSAFAPTVMRGAVTKERRTMKYSINGFRQIKLLEFNLDNNDSLILNWIYSSYCNAELYPKDFSYRLIRVQDCIDDLPCLGITTKRGMLKRFEKYDNKGLIDRVTDEKSSKTYIKILPKLNELSGV